MRPEQLMAARLQGEVYAVYVRWEGKAHKYWLPEGITYRLTLPKHVHTYSIDVAGDGVWWSWELRWSEATWHPERPRGSGPRKTYIRIRQGTGKRATYRRVKE